MHSHTIARALTDARAADLQRAVTRTTATMPRRRHRRHVRALFGVTAAAALAAGAPPGADARVPYENPAPAQDLRALARTSSLAGTTEWQDLRSPDTRDAAAGRGTQTSPDVVLVKVPQAAPEPSSAGGIDLADAGIGAGSLLGLSLVGLGGALVIVRRRRAGHGAPPVAGL